MSKSRLAFILLLALVLTTAPVVQALAGAVAPGMAGMHHAQTDQPPAADPGHEHSDHKKTCAQHDTCNGSCCANCALSFTGIPSPAHLTEASRPVLTPSVQRLLFSSLIFLRERPPRATSL